MAKRPPRRRTRCMVPLAGVVAGTLSAMAGAAGTAAMSRQDCITALPLEARVGQVLLAMSTTPAGALDAVQAGRVTGWAPIGNVDVAQLPALRSTTARN